MTTPCCNHNCRQGRDCPLRKKDLLRNRQQESIERPARAVGDDDKVRGARDQQSIADGKS